MMQRHNGFSLLEILVAFAIMAVALTIILRIFSSGVSNAIHSEDYTIATQIAESLMARTGVESPLQIGSSNGIEADKYRWQIQVSPFNQVSVNSAQTGLNTSTELWAVEVRVSWGDEGQTTREIALNNYRLLPSQNQP